jgi:hypothetical protein
VQAARAEALALLQAYRPPLPSAPLLELRLRGAGIGDGGARAIARAVGTTGWRLQLAAGGGPGAAAGSWWCWRGLCGSQLRLLELSDNHIGDDGAQALAAALAVQARVRVQVQTQSPPRTREGMTHSLQHADRQCVGGSVSCLHADGRACVQAAEGACNH